MLKRFLAGLAALALVAQPVAAASLAPPTGPLAAGDINAIVNNLVQSINAGVTPQSMAPFANFRNYLDNGEFNVTQRGTTAVTGINATATYLWDRWAGYANNASQNITLTNVTSGLPTAPINAAQVGRTSGSNTTQACLVQEIPTADVPALAGQPVTLSFYALAGAGLATAASNTLQVYLNAGTGTDQGLSTLIGSAPTTINSFTGASNPISTSQVISTSWARYTFTGQMPVGAMEAAVQICYTPSGATQSNEYFQVDEVQLEQGSTASAFENRPYAVELAKAQRYFWRITEPAASVNVTLQGAAASATQCNAVVKFPVTMRSAPTLTASTVTSGTTWQAVAVGVAANTSAIATYTANTTDTANLNITTAGMTAGQACGLQGKGGGATLSWSADF